MQNQPDHFSAYPRDIQRDDACPSRVCLALAVFMNWKRLVSWVFVCAIYPCTWSAESPSPPPWTAGTLPVGLNLSLSPAQDAAALELLECLPKIPELGVENGTVTWRVDRGALQITGIEPVTGEATLATSVCQVTIPVALIAQRNAEIIAELPELLRQAVEAHLTRETWHVVYGAMTGTALQATGLMITAQGLLRNDELIPSDRSGDLKNIQRIVTTLIAALPATGLDPIDCRALRGVLERLVSVDAPGHEWGVKPSFARRLIRHGYLRQWYRSPGDREQVAALEKAVERSVQYKALLQPVPGYNAEA